MLGLIYRYYFFKAIYFSNEQRHGLRCLNMHRKLAISRHLQITVAG